MVNVDKLVDIFQNHRDELGFINEAQVREKSAVVVERDGGVVGGAIYNHCVRKPQTTLYDIAVIDEYKAQGVGHEIIMDIVDETPHNKIIAKCPIDLEANQFYNKTGWELVGVESGKNRNLSVWRYNV